MELDEISGSEWRSCAHAPPLGESDAHVWRIALEVNARELPQLASVLEASEHERAGRYRFERLRNRFTVARACMRILLGQYLSLAPRDLRFSFGAHGKPALADADPALNLHFNLSHSEDLALFAITRVGAIGVDVEHLRPVRDTGELVARFFSSRENREFARLPETERPHAFFNLWTRKEALLKATGEGIAHSLNKVEVTFKPGEPARLLALPGKDLADEWFLKHLEPAPGYTGAVVVQGRPQETRTYTFNASAAGTE